ncbi:MAG TPA: hypothetical protein VGR28_07650 [Candidatus Thermoplasmatota archaeon]|nr:hypothetical protein [Candidatus Thermoplasmatota archaeon]
MTTLPAQAVVASSSPYGLEAHRVALLRRRRRALLALILLGLFGAIVFIATTIQEGSDISTFGGGNHVEVSLPDKPRTKPTTLSVSPGRTTVLEKPIQPEARAEQRGSPDELQGGGLNWLGLLQILGPPIAGALYAWRVGKKRALGSLQQVNLGVYKGALPLELHSATHKKFIFTPKMAHGPLFGAREAAAQIVAKGAARVPRVP